MTLKEISTRAREIIRCGKDGDDEAAHCREDELIQEFIRWVANNPTDKDIPKMARQLIKLSNADFSRWYA